MEAALDAVLAGSPADMHMHVAEEGIAAVEVIAKMLNKGTQQDPYTIAADHWVRTHAFKPDMPLLGKASKVLDHVTYPTCELVNAWFRPEAKDA